VHLFVGVVALAVFASTAGRLLVASDTFSHADAIIVLGGGSANRAEHAVDLYERDYAPLVVFSGGTLRSAGLACSSALLSLETAKQLGLPDEAIVIADEAQSTYDEAVNLRRLSGDRGWRSLIVVTDPFHTRRAARTFRTLLSEVIVYVSAAPNPNQGAVRWWQNEHGLVAVPSEVIKLVFYWCRYGIVPFEV
jgi:uncharacterized SAM-binding protein YcdF (DUF218 family)